MRSGVADALARLLPRALREGYGWTQASVFKANGNDGLLIVGVSRCGHSQQVELVEQVLEFNPPAAGDAIATAIQTQRSCFCVERVEPRP